MTHKQNTTLTFPIFSIAFFVLLILKVGGFSGMSWWWVFSPIFIGIVFYVAAFLFIVVVTIIAELLARR